MSTTATDTRIDLAEMLKPKPLEYYRNLVPRNGVAFTGFSLSRDQCAAILKAHDRGIAALAAEEVDLLDQVMSTLKPEIWA